MFSHNGHVAVGGKKKYGNKENGKLQAHDDKAIKVSALCRPLLRRAG